MSVAFNGTNSKLQLNAALSISYPFSVFVWMKPTSATVSYMVAGVGEDGFADNALFVFADGAGDTKVKAFARDTGSSSASSTTAQSTAWQPALAVFTSAASRTIYYASGAAVTNTTSITPTLASIGRITVGCRNNDTLHFDGEIAHVAMWSAALTQGNFDSLAAGDVPNTVAAGSLYDYWALATSAATHTGVNGRVLTSFGGVSTGASDPPVGSAPILSSPTVVSTGNGIATVGATTDTPPTVGTPFRVRTRPAADPAWTEAQVNAAPTQSITSGASGARTFALTGLPNGVAHQADYAHGASNVVSTVSFTPSTVPGAPTIGTAVAGNAQATVAGTAPASNGGAAITGYRSTATPGGSTITGASLPITHTGLSNGVAYTFTLEAENVRGYGAPSAASNSVTPSTGAPPPPPPPPPPPGPTLPAVTTAATGSARRLNQTTRMVVEPFTNIESLGTGTRTIATGTTDAVTGQITLTGLAAGTYAVFGFFPSTGATIQGARFRLITVT